MYPRALRLRPLKDFRSRRRVGRGLRRGRNSCTRVHRTKNPHVPSNSGVLRCIAASSSLVLRRFPRSFFFFVLLRNPRRPPPSLHLIPMLYRINSLSFPEHSTSKTPPAVVLIYGNETGITPDANEAPHLLHHVRPHPRPRPPAHRPRRRSPEPRVTPRVIRESRFNAACSRRRCAPAQPMGTSGRG